MLKRVLQFLVLAAVVNVIYQHWPLAEAEELIPVVNSLGKWGYVDGDGRVRIPFQWPSAKPFYGGDYAEIGSVFKYGMINRKGEVIIDPVWDALTSVNEFGLARVQSEDSVWWVDLKGQQVFPDDSIRETVYLSPFQPCGLATFCVGNDRYGLLNAKGEVAIEPVWEDISRFGPQGIAAAEGEEGWFLINTKGEVVADLGIKYAKVSQFGENGLAMIFTSGSQDVFVDQSAVRYGWIDLQGEVVILIEWEYEGAQDFDQHGMAPVKKGGKWGWIDESGELVIPLEWDNIVPFGESDHTFVNKGGVGRPMWDWQLIDREGNVITTKHNVNVSGFNKYGLAIIDSSKGAGFINERGEMVVDPIVGLVDDFDDGGTAKYRTTEGSGLIDLDGNKVFLDGMKIFEFDPKGMAKVQSHDNRHRIGWINRSGELVIEIPQGEGWQVHGWKEYPWNYTLLREREMSMLRSWFGRLSSWISGDPISTRYVECRTFATDGTLIWNSTWLRPETKSFLYLSAALLPLLVVTWLGHKKKKMANRKS